MSIHEANLHITFHFVFLSLLMLSVIRRFKDQKIQNNLHWRRIIACLHQDPRAEVPDSYNFNCFPLSLRLIIQRLQYSSPVTSGKIVNCISSGALPCWILEGQGTVDSGFETKMFFILMDGGGTHMVMLFLLKNHMGKRQ